LSLFIILSLLSPKFKYELPLTDAPVLLMTSILAVAGVIYLVLAAITKRDLHSKRLVVWIIIIGCAVRIVTIFSTPILEDDYFRYLWDGAVTAKGVNPFTYAPKSIIEHDASIPDKLERLAIESGNVIQRINHPNIRTIYPVVTQAAFAAAYLLSPWNLSGWRVVLLIVDLVNLILLLRLLKFLNLPGFLIFIYWWNPLLVKVTFNSGHMDILIIPLVFGAILLLMKNKHLLSFGMLALGVGVKLWPVLLLPLFLKRVYPDFKKMIAGFLIFACITILVFVPVYTSGVDETSGFETYPTSWENNDAFFVLPVWIGKLLLPIFKIHPGYAYLAARITVFIILIGLIAWLMVRGSRDNYRFLNQCLVIIAAAFLISPTQFPWYFVWVIPFLTLNPKMSILILTALLPLYYLRFYLEPRGLITYFNYGVVWLEFVPVWILLILDWVKLRKSRTIPGNQYRLLHEE